MPSDSAAGVSLHSPWAEFLEDVDRLLPRPVALHCLGGFTLMALHGLPRPTGDIDYVAAIPAEEAETIQQIAGMGSELAAKYEVKIHYVTIGDIPENYEERLVEIFPERFSKLRLLALEAHDLVLSKLTRNHPIDHADVEFLAKAGALKPHLLWDRYQSELRPNLANQERHDLTLKLWLEDYLQWKLGHD